MLALYPSAKLWEFMPHCILSCFMVASHVHDFVALFNTRMLINIHEPFFVFLFSVQQDATETW